MTQLVALHQEYPTKAKNDNWVKDLQNKRRLLKAKLWLWDYDIVQLMQTCCRRRILSIEGNVGIRIPVCKILQIIELLERNGEA